MVAIPLLTAVLLAGNVNGQHTNRPPAKAPAAHARGPNAKATVPPERRPESRRDRTRPENNPGSAEHLAQLLKLSPEQRDLALSNLPPGRRTQIEKRLNDYQNMPEEQRARALERLRRMQSLPPQKQQQVRSSVKKLTALPQPRRGFVQKQINQMRQLSDDDRRALMNTEEFRSKFTLSEQQMIEDICLVTAQR